MLVDRFIGIEHLGYDENELNKILFFLKNIKDLTEDEIGGSITVAVNGDWGSGKTSYLKIAESFFRDYLGYPVLFFEAWKFQNDTDYFLSLIYELRQLPIKNRFVKTALTKLFKSVSTGIAISSKVFAKVDFKDVKDFIKHYEELTYEGYSKHRDETDKLRKIIKGILDRDRDILILEKGVNHYNQYLWKALFKDESLENLKSEFESIAKENKTHPLVDYYNQNIDKKLSNIEEFFEINPIYEKKELVPSHDKLVLIIDDLDRLIPRKAFKMIETLRFYFDIEDVIVLMGVNDRVIEKYINKIYHLNDEDISDKFLEKIFQHSFRLQTSEINNIHLRAIRNKNEKNTFKTASEGFSFNHRKWIKILNRTFEKKHSKQVKNFDCLDILEAILDEMFPEYDFSKREYPKIHKVELLCNNLNGKGISGISKDEASILSETIERMKKDRTFTRYSEELLKFICERFNECKKQPERDEKI